MNIIIDSVYDRPGVCPVYDEPGVCPKCGQPMRAIRLYRADTQTLRDNPKQTYQGGRWVTTQQVSTQYSNIQPCALGFCDACYRAEQERLRVEKAQNPPSPSKWLPGAILAGVGLVVMLVRLIAFNEQKGLLLGLGLLAFMAGLYLFFQHIGKYSKQRKEYLRCKAGERDDSPMTASAIASVLTARTPNAYLTEESLGQLQKNNDPLARFR